MGLRSGTTGNDACGLGNNGTTIGSDATVIGNDGEPCDCDGERWDYDREPCAQIPLSSGTIGSDAAGLGNQGERPGTHTHVDMCEQMCTDPGAMGNDQEQGAPIGKGA